MEQLDKLSIHRIIQDRNYALLKEQLALDLARKVIDASIKLKLEAHHLRTGMFREISFNLDKAEVLWGRR